MSRREVVSLMSFTSYRWSIVSTIVRYYIKESIHNTLMCKWGLVLNTYAAALVWPLVYSSF